MEMGQLHTIRFSPPLFKEAAQDSSAPKALKLIVDNILSHGPLKSSWHDHKQWSIQLGYAF